MALNDPQSIKFASDSAAISLPRTSTGANSSDYTSGDSATKLSVFHSYGKRTRRYVKVVRNKIVPNPLVTSQNVQISLSAQVILDHPVNGFTAVELADSLMALADYVKASGNAAAVVGGQN